MKKPTAWMPMYWGDYLRDTGHLSAEEHGVYLLLIAHYWSTGRPLPADDRKLSKMGRVNSKRWTAIKSTISEFFQVENGAWHHGRIERELIDAYDRKDAAKERGKRGAEARWGDRASIEQASSKQCLGIASHSHIHTSDHESDSESLTDAARDPALANGSGPRASQRETMKERVAKLTAEKRRKFLEGRH